MRRRPEAYHETLRAPRGGAVADGGDGLATAAPTSIHDMVRVKEPGLAARLVYDAYERRSGLVRFLGPDATRRATGPRAGATELGDAVDGAFDLVDLGPGPPRHPPRGDDRRGGRDGRRRRSSSAATGGARRSRAQVRAGAPRRAGHRRAARPRVDADDARRRRQPVGLVGGRRRRGPATTSPARRPGVTDPRPGQRLHRRSRSQTDLDEPADAWWAPIETVSNSESGFERVYQGSGLLLSWPLRLAPGERVAAYRPPRRDHDPRPDRATRRREPTAPRRPRALLPAAAPRSVHRARRRSTRRPRRPATGTTRISADCYRPNAELGNLGGDVVGPRADARRLDGSDDGDPVAYRGFVAGDRGVERDGPAVPPHDPAARLGRRPADRDPLGPARLRAPLRPTADRDVAARDGRRPGDAAAARRRGHRPHDPRPVAGRRRTGLDTRRPYGSTSATAGRWSSRSTTGCCRRPSRSSRARRSTPTRSSASGSGRGSTEPLARRRRRRSSSSPRTASCTATTSRSASTSWRASSARPRRRTTCGFDAPGARRRPAARPRGGPLPVPVARLRERTSWSCHHGVVRWSAGCACVPDGAGRRRCGRRSSGSPADIDAATERLARALPGSPDPWAARDAYVDVVIGAITPAAFADAWLGTGTTPDDRQRLLPRAHGGAALAARDVRQRAPGSGTTRSAPRPPALRAAARAARLVDGLAGTTSSGARRRPGPRPRAGGLDGRRLSGGPATRRPAAALSRPRTPARESVSPRPARHGLTSEERGSRRRRRPTSRS